MFSGDCVQTVGYYRDDLNTSAPLRPDITAMLM